MTIAIFCVGAVVLVTQLFTVGLVIQMGNSVIEKQDNLEFKVDKLSSVDAKFDSLLEQMR